MVTIKHAQLWYLTGADQGGLLARILEPLAVAGVNLEVVMAYCHPGEPAHATVEVFPIAGAKAEAAAKAAGLAPLGTPCLVVEGDDRPGLGAALARGVAQAGVSMSFLMASTLGTRFAAVVGLRSEPDAAKAARAIEAAARQDAGGAKV